MLISQIMVTLILATGLKSRHLKKQKYSANHNNVKESDKLLDNSARDAVLKKVKRLIQCPVCSDEELDICNWDALNAVSTCEIEEHQSCNCCPKCKAKEGEFCGFSENQNRPGYVHDFRGCEAGLECSTLVGDGICEIINYGIPEMEYTTNEYSTNEYTTNEYSTNEYTTNENDDSLEYSVLEEGCETHAANVRNMLFFYPTAVVQHLWTPACQPERPYLYKSIQCRSKGTFGKYDCWCVYVDSGVPTIHMLLAPFEINERLCEKLEQNSAASAQDLEFSK